MARDDPSGEAGLVLVERRFVPQAEPTREAWLKAGAAAVATIMREKTGLTAPPSYVSVGFPKGRSVARREGGRSWRVLGQCWNGALSRDGTAHIFVCPTQDDATGVLDVLLHEQIHATVGTEAGHKGAFARTAKAIGYQRPWATPTPGPELLRRLNRIAEDLGTYPHAALVPKERKVGSRLRLFECPCGIKARVARDTWGATCHECGGDYERC